MLDDKGKEPKERSGDKYDGRQHGEIGGKVCPVGSHKEQFCLRGLRVVNSVVTGKTKEKSSPHNCPTGLHKVRAEFNNNKRSTPMDWIKFWNGACQLSDSERERLAQRLESLARRLRHSKRAVPRPGPTPQHGPN